jgi:diguanylate cyclase (GGDEF)-like protein
MPDRDARHSRRSRVPRTAARIPAAAHVPTVSARYTPGMADAPPPCPSCGPRRDRVRGAGAFVMTTLAVAAIAGLAGFAGAASAATNEPAARATTPPATAPSTPPATAAATRPATAATDHPAAALIARATVALRDDPDASRRDAELALAQVQRRPDPDLEIRARILLCDYWSEREPVAARAQIAAARTLLARATRPSLAAGLHSCEGEILEIAGDNAGARTAFDEAVRVATEGRDDEMLAGALFARGYLLGVQGEYATGLLDLKRSEQLYDRVKMPQHSLTALNSIAILYNRMGDYAEAQHIYQRALDAQRAAGMRREQGVTLHNIGRTHEKLGEWPQARKAFEDALAIHREIGYGRGEAYALRGLASVANAANEPGTALGFAERAAKLEAATPDARLRGQILLARGTALRLQARHADGLAALDEARTVFERGDAVTELVATYDELAAVKAALGDWRGAYEAQRSTTQITEKLLRNQLDQRFAALKVEFDTASRQKENELLMRANAAAQRELAQQERARSLQYTVLALTAALAAVLATLAIRQWRGSRRMHELAMTDELTGVPNRRAVLQRLAALLKARTGERLSIALIDVDNFKSINDEHGHPAGDEVLKVIAERVRALVMEPAFIGRLGGEEFLVVLPNQPLDQACALGERLRASVMQIDVSRWFPDGRGITASLGVTAQISDDDTPSTLLQRADAALYEAKRTGRNRVVADATPLRHRAA